MKWSKVMAGVACAATLAVAPVAMAQGASEQGEAVAHELVEHQEPAARAAALIALGGVGGADARAVLEAARVADIREERIAAGLGLILLGDRGAVAFTSEQIAESNRVYEALREAGAVLDAAQMQQLTRALLTVAEPVVRRDVYRFLATRSGDLYAQLGQGLRDSDESVREAARQALVHSARAETLPIAEGLLGQRDVANRQEALHLLKALHHRADLRADVVAQLSRGLTDRDAAIQEGAARQLVELQEAAGVNALVDRLATLETADRITLAQFLLEYSPRVEIAAMRPILASLEGEGEQAERERQVLYELAATSRDATLTEELKAWFSSNTFENRVVSAGALGRTGDASVLPLLARGLFEGQTVIRHRSARSLGHLGDEEGLTHLRRAITSEREKPVKIEAISAVGRIRAERSVQVLRFLVTDNDPEIKFAVVEALDNIGLPEATQGLEVLLRDRNLEIQWKAFLSLLRINPDTAQRHINQALRNPPETFGNDLDPFALTERARETVYQRLLTHSGNRVRNTAAQHASIHRDVLLPIARQQVLNDALHPEVRRELVHLLVGEGDPADHGRLDRVMRNYPTESSAAIAAWALASRDAESFEASFRGMLGRDQAVLRGIAAFAMTQIP